MSVSYVDFVKIRDAENEEDVKPILKSYNRLIEHLDSIQPDFLRVLTGYSVLRLIFLTRHTWTQECCLFDDVIEKGLESAKEAPNVKVDEEGAKVLLEELISLQYQIFRLKYENPHADIEAYIATCNSAMLLLMEQICDDIYEILSSYFKICTKYIKERDIK